MMETIPSQNERISRSKEETTKLCPNTILSLNGTIISYLIAFERLFRTKQTKKEPACSVVEQAGVPIDRVIGLSIDRVLIAQAWSMLFYFLTCEGIFLLPAEDVDLTVTEELGTLYLVTWYIFNPCSIAFACRGKATGIGGNGLVIGIFGS